MKKIKSFFMNLRSENNSLRAYRYNNTPTLNKFERIVSFITLFIYLIICALCIFGSCNVVSADEPITYLGGSRWSWQGRSLAASSGSFSDLNGRIRFRYVGNASYSEFEYYELHFGYMYDSSSESLQPLANTVCVRNKLGIFTNISLSNLSTLTIEFFRDTEVTNYYWDLFNPSLISVLENFMFMSVNPGSAFIITSGEYFFTRFRSSNLRAFELPYLHINDSITSTLKFTIFDPVSSSDVTSYQEILLSPSYGSPFVRYAYRDLPSGSWVDSNGLSNFPSFTIDEDYIVYYESVFNSFSLLFSRDYVSDSSSYQDGFLDGLEQGFVFNFIEGVFNALDAFPITSQFSLFDLFSSLIGFFIILWLLKLIAGG